MAHLILACHFHGEPFAYAHCKVFFLLLTVGWALHTPNTERELPRSPPRSSTRIVGDFGESNANTVSDGDGADRDLELGKASGYGLISSLSSHSATGTNQGDVSFADDDGRLAGFAGLQPKRPASLPPTSAVAFAAFGAHFASGPQSGIGVDKAVSPREPGSWPENVQNNSYMGRTPEVMSLATQAAPQTPRNGQTSANPSTGLAEFKRRMKSFVSTAMIDIKQTPLPQDSPRCRHFTASSRCNEECFAHCEGQCCVEDRCEPRTQCDRFVKNFGSQVSVVGSIMLIAFVIFCACTCYAIEWRPRSSSS
eukprot:TRINITY_DN3804_c0_g1_i1.p1 TRINITY_DN3804_c0_g1~~TRINITY_DN3804_c0_g1_i1.p1  ORF type:complete len:309 (-),score=45.42 TRINITY_DN3804_c0_g1_i1:22-948(-)